MINNTLRQLITEETEKLPGYQRVVLAKFDWVHELETIAVKHDLVGEKESILISETAMVILRINDGQNLARELKTQLNLDDQQVTSIIEDISLRVANRIQKELDDMMGDLTPFIQQEIEEQIKQNDTLADIGLTISDTPIMTTSLPTPEDKIKMTLASGDQKITSYEEKDPYHEPVE